MSPIDSPGYLLQICSHIRILLTPPLRSLLGIGPLIFLLRLSSSSNLIRSAIVRGCAADDEDPLLLSPDFAGLLPPPKTLETGGGRRGLLGGCLMDVDLRGLATILKGVDVDAEGAELLEEACAADEGVTLEIEAS